MPKMHPNTFDGRALPGPTVELMCSPDPLAALGGLLLRGGREGEGCLLLRGLEGSRGGRK